MSDANADTDLTKREVLDGVMRLLDFSIDINTRIDDIRFAEDPDNEIIYVFDENVFEMFIDPSRQQFRVMSFHDSDWAPVAKRGERQFQEQAGLLSAEYLLSGNLIGARDNNIYMTGWHQRELASRLEQHSRDINTLSRSDLRRVGRELRWKAQLLELVEGQKDQSDVEREFTDSWLRRDQKAIQDQSGIEVSRLLRYSRMLSRMFVKCPTSERIEQLNRISDLGISDRIQSLEDRFEINVEPNLASAVHDWLDLLVAEGDKSTYKAKRKPAGFSVDANSLALIQWLSDHHLSRNQRIVFVSGDKLLYRAYRRWYCQQALERNFTPNFVVRRLTQYSPVISADEVPGPRRADSIDEEERNRLIDDVTQTVEVSLLPFNLSLLRDNLPGYQRDAIFRARHNLVLQYREQDPSTNLSLRYFIERLRPEYFVDQDKKLKEIRDLWRKIERMTIGTYFTTLVSRLQFRDRVFSNQSIHDLESEEELEAVVGQIISETADELFNRLAERWIPTARDFLEDLKTEALIDTRRAPKSIWFPAHNGTLIGEQIRKWRTSKDQELLERLWGSDGFVPYDVFGLAAAFALFSHGWLEAERFASLAIRSGHAHDAPQVKTVELEYMNCLAKRFLFADSKLHFPNATEPKSDLSSVSMSVQN